MDVIVCLLRWAAYTGLAGALFIAIWVAPGWWWGLMGLALLLSLGLGVAEGLGSRRAARVSAWLFGRRS